MEKRGEPSASGKSTPPRHKTAQERSVLESWFVLPARTRLYLSVGFAVFAAAGLYASDQLEKWYPPVDKDTIAQGATKDAPP
ncbi:uncharacterized protein LAESUDRAFT_811317 [Laetiporus sulphureus 93-53]|uniref:Uncharacterized protein n=1 Tax=Laetiporus sulphureus 93-53 TaxID=1314785 RepID=A0A165FBF9_9APHY|nr:uncharacterized protein LAESUDRAFT_811317 [Laetiporus sulphureus 93-53]KZT08713.1 hypothetical protein LAESUDRAFT_811317 [Laetiporus sulphureus 93-53]